MTITCGKQPTHCPTGVVTTVVEMLHNIYNQACDLPDMYALRFQTYMSGKSFTPMLQPLHAYIN